MPNGFHNSEGLRNRPILDTHVFRRLIRRAFLLPLVLVLFLGGSLFWQLQQVVSSLQWVDHSDLVLQHARLQFRYMVDMERAAYGSIAFADRSEDDFTAAQKGVESETRELERLVSDNPEQTKHLADIKDVYQLWQRAAADLMHESGRSRTLVPAESLRERQLMDYTRQLQQEFVGTEEKLRELRLRRAEELHLYTAVAVLALTIAIAAVIAFYTRRQIRVLSESFTAARDEGVRQAALAASAQEKEKAMSALTALNATLKKSEEELKDAQRISHLGSWHLVISTGEVTWSEELYRMLGLDPSAPPPPYSEHRRLFSPQSWERLAASVDRALECGEPYQLELEIVRPDGSTGWMLARGEAVRDDVGAITGLRGTAQDITERRQARDSLARSEARLQAQIERMPMACITWDKDWRIQTWNPAAEAIFGFKKEEVVGRHPYEFIVPAEVRSDMDAVFDRLHQGAEGSQINENFTKDKRRILVRWTNTPLREGNEITGVLSMAEDITEKKEAEDTLRRQAALLDLAHDAIFVRDLESKILFWNHGAEVTYGWNRKEAIACISHDLLQTKFPIRLEEIDRTVREQGLWEGELTQVTKGGEVIIVASRWSLQRDENGLPSAVLEINRDISERKKAEAAVAAERQKFNTILDVLPPYVVLLTPDYHVAFSNREFRERFGESGGRRCFEFLFNRTKPCEICETYKVLKTGKQLDWEWTGPDGREYEIHDFPFTDTDGSKLILEMGVDVTARKRAEAERQESEKNFRVLANFVPQLVWMCGPDGANTYFNQRWVEYTGMTLEESYGTGWNTPFHPDDKQAAWDAWNHATATGDTYRSEARLRAADGTYRWFLMRGVPLRDDDGQIVRWFGTCTDIDDMKRAEEELRRLNAELDHRVQQRTAELRKIEWMLSAGKTGAHDSDDKRAIPRQSYGDLTQLNTNRTILDSVGSPLLQDIARDYMGLLDTSAAIYEKNGDYALGIFSSGWCQFLDSASRRNCNTDDNRKALTCGQWTCHESCWNLATRPAIETGLPIDVECAGGIRLYAVPICAGDEIVGGINFGYGDPPQDEATLRQIAAAYNVGIDDLRERAAAYESRPPYIIELAKKRLRAAADLIGEIVQRKRTEQELARTRNVLAEGQRIAHLGTFEYIVDNRTTVWSEEEYRIYGLDSASPSPDFETILTKSIHPDDVALLSRTFKSAMETRSTYELEHRVVRPDGTIRWVYDVAYPYFSDTGKLVRYIGATMDITERKSAEEAIRALNLNLQRQAAELQTIFDTVPIGLAITNDREGRHIRGNPANERMLGVPPGGELSKRSPDVTFRITKDGHELRAEELPMQRAARGETVTGETLEAIRSDGQVITMYASAAPLFDEQDQPRGAVGAFVDITERKRVEQQLHQRTAELQAANKELEAFNYAVAHDLRAPLRHIHGFSELLAEEASAVLDEGAKKHLDTIRDSVQHMERLLEDLLSLSRLGRQELSTHVCGLRSIVDEVVTSLNPEVQNRTVQWRIGDLPFLECDPGLMRQVITNLLTNALKFTRPRDPAVIEIGQEIQNGDPVIFVRDNGVGFSMKYVDKLFGLFQRLHRQQDFEGTGVGLAIVQRIVHKHGGQVWAEGELNKGATFYFKLHAAVESMAHPVARDVA